MQHRLCLSPEQVEEQVSDESDETAREALIEAKSDPHHRVRTSAVRELLRALPEGAERYHTGLYEDVGEMLSSTSPRRRLAAAWCVERLGGAGRIDPTSGAGLHIAERILGLMESDEDERVRLRAHRAALRLAALGAARPIDAPPRLRLVGGAA